MTVGQMKQILERSGLSDDAPIYTCVTDVHARDGHFEVMACQIETDTSDGLTVYLERGHGEPPVLVGFGMNADTDIFENDSE